MLVTAVRGHLVEYDFKGDFKNWNAVDPGQLFDAELDCRVSTDCQPIVACLMQAARSCQQLVLWLDCDREGEAICFEVMQQCRRANPGIIVRRALFSALTHADISNACRTLTAPNSHMSNAVVARIEIDLRSGAALTRFLTLRYRAKLTSLCQGGKPILSYGPCQFPTLGLIYDRWASIQSFIAEPFWSLTLKVSYSFPSTDVFTCLWERNRIFDELVIHALFDRVSTKILDSDGLISIVELTPQARSRWRPSPLNTVEMTKLVSSKLHIPSHRCMQIAESLYTKGVLSYPRTETEVYHHSMDVRGLVNLQAAHSIWGQYCTELLGSGRYLTPRFGQKNDNAHPPIHPVRSVEQAHLDYDEWRVYELVARHFIATCSPDARGSNTNVKFKIDEEVFTLDGLVVTEKNWLEIFHYEKWNSSAFKIPAAWRLGTLVLVSDLSITESRTTPPLLLSESELISKMDGHGIGTDATMHEHIRTVQERNYVLRTGDARFCPTPLGIALARGFAAYEGVSALIQPDLRSAMENEIASIARGELNPREFLIRNIRKLKQIFAMLSDYPLPLDDAIRGVEAGDDPRAHGPAARRIRGSGRGRGRGGVRRIRTNRGRR
jgi:DNA topoisomerase III